MPELGTLKQVHQGTIRILGVSQDVLRPISLQTAVIHWDGIPYEGEYIVTPRTTQQSLETKHKTMRDDVTVLEIPYYQTSNEAGGYTVIIADE